MRFLWLRACQLPSVLHRPLLLLLLLLPPFLLTPLAACLLVAWPAPLSLLPSVTLPLPLFLLPVQHHLLLPLPPPHPHPCLWYLHCSHQSHPTCWRHRFWHHQHQHQHQHHQATRVIYLMPLFSLRPLTRHHLHSSLNPRQHTQHHSLPLTYHRATSQVHLKFTLL